MDRFLSEWQLFCQGRGLRIASVSAVVLYTVMLNALQAVSVHYSPSEFRTNLLIFLIGGLLFPLKIVPILLPFGNRTGVPTWTDYFTSSWTFFSIIKKRHSLPVDIILS